MYGDIKSFTFSNDAVGISIKEPEEYNRGEKIPNECSTLDDWDIVLVAIKTIHLGDEIFISYKGKGQGEILRRKNGSGSCFSIIPP